MRPPRSRPRRALLRSRPTPGVAVWSVLSWFNPSTDHRQSEARIPLFHRALGNYPIYLAGWFRGSLRSHLNHRNWRPESREAAATPSPPRPRKGDVGEPAQATLRPPPVGVHGPFGVARPEAWPRIPSVSGTPEVGRAAVWVSAY